MVDQRLTRTQYQSEITKKKAKEAVAPELKPISQQELTHEVKEYEKNMKAIALWPFIGLINWALKDTAKKGNTKLSTSLSNIIKLGNTRLNLNGEPLDDESAEANTLHTVQSEIINNYANKYAVYLAQKELPNRPVRGLERMLWELTHNKLFYETQAKDCCIKQWQNTMHKIKQDIQPLVIVHNRISKEYSKICQVNKIFYNTQLHIHDIGLVFDFSNIQ